jgi:thiol-disulfide isomerase/thioredoxin
MRRGPVCFSKGVVTGEIVTAVILVGATAAGAGWRWRSGRMRVPRAVRRAQAAQAGQAAAAGPAAAGPPGPAQPRVTATELGVPLGEQATLLQFSSSFCAPCRATRTLLADVAGRAEGVRHVEVNVDDRLDLVRRLDVRRTPTVFVLGPDGRIARQASGQPRRQDVLAALALARSGQA